VIILDTNVIAELMKGPSAGRVVRGWVRALRETPVTTVINRAEILSGIAVLPDGRRKQALLEVAEDAFQTLGVCLPLTPESATAYAMIVARRREGGRPIAAMDALVAAIAVESGAVLATRDVRDFEGLGLDLVDPWQGG